MRSFILGFSLFYQECVHSFKIDKDKKLLDGCVITHITF